MRVQNAALAFVFTLAVSLIAPVVSAVPVLDDTPTRVQTLLRVRMRQVGTLKPKAVGEISSSRWTVDCACLDREQVDWRAVREYVAPLGIARVRLQAGWARCEKDPGRYDFAWLDQAVFDAKRMGVDTWLELSYGNPSYPGGGGRQLSAGFPSSPEGLAAWDRWVEKIVTHYKGTVKDFCVWNEPDNPGSGNTPAAAADFAIRTAEIVKRIVPDASVAAFALGSAKMSFVEPLVMELKRRGRIGLFTSIAYHHYAHNPDDGYEAIEACRRFLSQQAPSLRLREGEGGTWSEWGGSGALSRYSWTELTQAKYDLRRSLGDLGHGDDTGVFHLCDIEYRTSGFHDGLVRYGLIKTTGQAEGYRVLKVKTAYYAIQNAVSVFNDALESLASGTTSRISGLEHGAVYDWRDRRTGLPVTVFWDASDTPRDSCETVPVAVRIKAKPFADPLWVDLLTGDAYEIAADAVREEDGWTVYDVPAYDSPTFVTDRSVLDLQRSWFVQATSGWRPCDRLPDESIVRKARFFGPFPKSTQAKSVDELERLGAGRTVEVGRGERGLAFNLHGFCPDGLRAGTLPDCAGYLALTIESERGGLVHLYERNDWFGQFYVNGEPVGDALKGDIWIWSVVPARLKAGRNEIVFRTVPGTSGRWTALLGVCK